MPTRPRCPVALGAIAALAVAVPGAAPPAAAAGSDPENTKAAVDAQLNGARHDLNESSAAVRRAADALQDVATRLPAAERAAAEARGALAAARARDVAAAHALVAAERAERLAEQEVADAERRMAAKRAAVGAFARARYQQGRLGALAVVVGAQTPDELASRVGLARAVLRADNAVLAALADERARLASRRATLRERRDQTAELRRQAAVALTASTEAAARAAAAEGNVRRLVAARSAAYALARREQADDARRYGQLQAESKRLAAIIRAQAAAARARARAGERRGAGGGGRRHRGSSSAEFDWPTNGPKTSSFGWRLHPIFHSRRFHAGIDIGAPTGTPVHAADDGEVIFVGRMSGYGNVVIVDHGSVRGRDISTLYAHLSRFSSHVGESVGRDEVIASVGSTGNSTGPHLHFEVRIDGNPVPPDPYL